MSFVLLLDCHQLHVEHQGGAARDDTARATLAVPQRGRDRQRALLTDAHAQQPCVPASDDLVLAEHEAEGLAAVARGIELRAVARERAGVVHRELVAALRDRAIGARRHGLGGLNLQPTLERFDLRLLLRSLLSLLGLLLLGSDVATLGAAEATIAAGLDRDVLSLQ